MNVKPEISFEEYLKADLRIGTVVSAEYIEDNKRLLKLEMDFGSEKRIIVSAIGDSFTSTTLVGKQLLCLINIPPRNMPGGVVSSGIILNARRSDGVAALAVFTGEVQRGSELGG
jgi:methionyl-tRNA synthetase